MIVDLPDVALRTVKFTGKGGWEGEQKHAHEAGFEVGLDYVVTGGELHSFSSTYTIEGIEGEWNTCLFEGPDLFHILRPAYKLDYVQSAA